MSGRGIWGLLGIERTDDVAAIRRAYAQALKRIDVDSDPQAFMALRQARETALGLAARSGVAVSEDASQGETAATAPGRPATSEEQAIEAHLQALVGILSGDEQTNQLPLGEPDRITLLGHFDALLKDPRLERVEFAASASDWVADTLARAVPRSDVLIEPAIRAFGWQSDAEIAQSRAVSFLRQRGETIAFLREVEKPGHRLNGAWRELETPASEGSRRGRVRRAKVFELLRLVRERHPSLESYFDWYRVSLWESHRTFWTGRRLWLAVWIVIVVAVQVARLSGDEGSSSKTRDQVAVLTPEEREEKDIDKALGPFGEELTATSLKARNPSLYAAIEDKWRATQEFGSAEDFDEGVRTLLLVRARAALAHADYPLLLEQARLELAEAKAAHHAGASACAAFFGGGPLPTDEITEEIRSRQRRLIADAVLDADRSDVAKRTSASANIDPSPARITFKLPATVATEAAARARLAPAGFRQAMNDQGGAASICAARLGLAETVVALPRMQATSLIRAMHGG